MPWFPTVAENPKFLQRVSTLNVYVCIRLSLTQNCCLPHSAIQKPQRELTHTHTRSNRQSVPLKRRFTSSREHEQNELVLSPNQQLSLGSLPHTQTRIQNLCKIEKHEHPSLSISFRLIFCLPIAILYKFLFICLFASLFLRSTCLRASDLTDRRLCYKWYKNHYETLVIIYTHSRLLFKTSHTNECGRELPRSELSLSLSLSMRRIFATHNNNNNTPLFLSKTLSGITHPPTFQKQSSNLSR
jgi:hypothetical protein